MATIPPHAPTPFPWADLVIILALVALNGVFAMSELAIVSARRPRWRLRAIRASSFPPFRSASR
jgi:CBS domain containing-hemolysin-like protein